nr:hypothetical protein [Tanacetum cinerariifolium]
SSRRAGPLPSTPGWRSWCRRSWPRSPARGRVPAGGPRSRGWSALGGRGRARGRIYRALRSWPAEFTNEAPLSSATALAFSSKSTFCLMGTSSAFC